MPYFGTIAPHALQAFLFTVQQKSGGEAGSTPKAEEKNPVTCSLMPTLQDNRKNFKSVGDAGHCVVVWGKLNFAHLKYTIWKY